MEIRMHPNTHNGFVLDYQGSLFPASRGNQISYEYFCLKGGLANGRFAKVERINGTYSYHDMSVRG